MFLPDWVTPQYLPNGKLPCKWHGYDHDCVRRDSFFNPQGPRACIDDDQGITYIFSGHSTCKIRENQDFEEGEDDGYYFVNHCKEVLTQLDPDVQSTLGAVITPKQAPSTGLI